ncbi:hypothetical protein M431DRAFT_511840 [Trichoderma harzianum CBS 226.95]|uniref:Uncharacterized protein n=1 Tax=Trichoderma harzianum CBS 226.95 TaxID=983964 RepID=A0A2T4A1M9_TRIHA|nr:hypothetical protein M431DRAFT_511840 [Trichoderma harzianum CBS 226.95]PTB50959.1 hypothetical protein M431DRAFT_511840 [Trichoderma harzianum CBS 226.95]
MEPDTSSTKAELATMGLSSVYLKGLRCYSGHVAPLEETPLATLCVPTSLASNSFIKDGIPSVRGSLGVAAQHHSVGTIPGLTTLRSTHHMITSRSVSILMDRIGEGNTSLHRP